MSQKLYARLEDALDSLSSGLRRFVEQEMRTKYGDAWEEEAHSALSYNQPEAKFRNKLNLNDPIVLLRLLKNRWNDVFRFKLQPPERNLVNELIGVRNMVKHRDTLSLDDAHRALDSIHRLLQAVAAPEARSIQIEKQEILTLLTKEWNSLEGPSESSGPTSKRNKDKKDARQGDDAPQGKEQASHLRRESISLPVNHKPGAFIHFQLASVINASLIRRLDNEVCKRMPDRLGWVLIDACALNPSSMWVHVRPYLNDQTRIPVIRSNSDQRSTSLARNAYADTLPESFHLEYGGEEFPRLTADSKYAAIFIRQDGQEIGPEVYNLIGAMESGQVPYFTICVFSNSDKVLVIDEGNNIPLAADLFPIRARRLAMTISGENQKQLQEFLPFDLIVKENGPEAAISITLNESSGFGHPDYHFIIRDPEHGQLGNVTLRVNASLQAGRPDEIILETPEGRNLTVRNYDNSPIVRSKVVFHEMVNLHLVYDRTTIDDSAWPAAFEGLEMGNAWGGEDGMYVSASTKSWNSDIRSALAAALTQKIDNLHEEVCFHLWWFADIARDEIAPNALIPSADEAYGRVGQCIISDLPNKLMDRSFDYVSGYDLFDAVDEVLERVANVIEEDIIRNHRQHAVLIVGDSPPPPSDFNDVLWQSLVEQPIRTNARCSARFKSALKLLKDLDIPVAWVYVRSVKTPWPETNYSYAARQFLSFASFKEEILGALHKIDDLIVEGCAGESDLARSLSIVFQQMSNKKSVVPGFRILRVSQADN